MTVCWNERRGLGEGGGGGGGCDAIYDPVLGSPTPPPPMVSPPPTLPKPNLCDCAHVFHMRAPKASTVTRIAFQDARSV